MIFCFQAKSEVVYLMQHLDLNNDKEISASEANSKPNIFLRSQVTFYGQLYELKNLRDEVFQVQDRRWKSGPGLGLRSEPEKPKKTFETKTKVFNVCEKQNRLQKNQWPVF